MLSASRAGVRAMSRSVRSASTSAEQSAAEKATAVLGNATEKSQQLLKTVQLHAGNALGGESVVPSSRRSLIRRVQLTRSPSLEMYALSLSPRCATLTECHTDRGRARSAEASLRPREALPAFAFPNHRNLPNSLPKRFQRPLLPSNDRIRSLEATRYHRYRIIRRFHDWGNDRSTTYRWLWPRRD